MRVVYIHVESFIKIKPGTDPWEMIVLFMASEIFGKKLDIYLWERFREGRSWEMGIDEMGSLSVPSSTFVGFQT